MAAIRVEDPEVFHGVHEKVFQYVGRGWVTGLRIDHADGLLDPLKYLENLRDCAAIADTDAGDMPPDGRGLSLFVAGRPPPRRARQKDGSPPLRERTHTP